MLIKKIIIVEPSLNRSKILKKQVIKFVGVKDIICFSLLEQINHTENEDKTLLLWSNNALDNRFVNNVNVFRNKFPNLKVVLLSNMENKNLLRNLISIGINGFILKSEPKEIFENMLRALSFDIFPFSINAVKCLATLSLSTTSLKQNPKLTRRENDVFNCLIKGLSNKAIARDLGLSPYTIADYNKSIYHKYKVKSRIALFSLQLNH